MNKLQSVKNRKKRSRHMGRNACFFGLSCLLLSGVAFGQLPATSKKVTGTGTHTVGDVADGQPNVTLRESVEYGIALKEGRLTIYTVVLRPGNNRTFKELTLNDMAREDQKDKTYVDILLLSLDGFATYALIDQKVGVTPAWVKLEAQKSNNAEAEGWLLAAEGALVRARSGGGKDGQPPEPEDWAVETQTRKPVLFFIRQGNKPIVTRGALDQVTQGGQVPGDTTQNVRFPKPKEPDFKIHGCHMVSNFQTDTNLPATTDFDGKDNLEEDLEVWLDPDTFRVEVVDLDLAPEQKAWIRLKVDSSGGSTYEEDFLLIPGKDDQKTMYRTQKYIRLVADIPDDNHKDKQTPRVKLGDTVQASLVLKEGIGEKASEAFIDGVEPIELQVAKPPANTSMNAIRTCRLNWVAIKKTRETFKADIPGTITRMNEVWAQTAIGFKEVDGEPEVHHWPTSEVLQISGTAAANGILKLTIQRKGQKAKDATKIEVTVEEEDSHEDLAKNLLNALQAAGFSTAGRVTKVAKRKDNKFLSSTLVVVSETDVDGIIVKHRKKNIRGISIKKETAKKTVPDMVTLAILGFFFKDDKPETLDVFSLPVISIRAWRSKSIGTAAAKIVCDGEDPSTEHYRLPPSLVNSFFITNGGVEKPFTPAHEAAHVLLNADHVFGDLIDSTGNDLPEEFGRINLLKQGPTNKINSIYASKRLTHDQQLRARNESPELLHEEMP